MKKNLKILGWIVAVLVLLLTFQVIRAGTHGPKTSEISYSEFLRRVADGQVSKVTITCNLVRAYNRDGGNVLVIAPSGQTEMLEALRQHGVEIWFRDAPTWPIWIPYLLPMLLVAALLFVVRRQGRRITRLEAAGH